MQLVDLTGRHVLRVVGTFFGHQSHLFKFLADRFVVSECLGF